MVWRDRLDKMLANKAKEEAKLQQLEIKEQSKELKTKVTKTLGDAIRKPSKKKN